MVSQVSEGMTSPLTKIPEASIGYFACHCARCFMSVLGLCTVWWGGYGWRWAMGILCLQLHLQVSQASDGIFRGDGEAGPHWGKSTVPCTGEVTRRHLGAPAYYWRAACQTFSQFCRQVWPMWGWASFSQNGLGGAVPCTRSSQLPGGPAPDILDLVFLSCEREGLVIISSGCLNS